MTDQPEEIDALVIGGGPAGLMAADALIAGGRRVVLAEQKPSLARKFLMAGKSGLNLTKNEPLDLALGAYGPDTPLSPILRAFGPAEVMAWAEGLGQPLFTGSSGRVFPKAMKASPLLRAWLEHLRQGGLEARTRWRWVGWDGRDVLFDTSGGMRVVRPDVTVLACGGASWSRLGSDGAWTGPLSDDGMSLAPFQPSNAGLIVRWSDHMRSHFGAALKNAVFSSGSRSNRGEVVISARGLEGGGLYPLTPQLRAGGPLTIDLRPDLSEAEISQRLARPRGKQSMANHLRKSLSLTPAERALLNEVLRPLPQDPAALAACLKAVPIPHEGPRPMDEAISTAGGIPFAELDAGLQLLRRPGVFAAGEMLDWDAPTGGYLLTACLATGLWAGRHAAGYRGAV